LTPRGAQVFEKSMFEIIAEPKTEWWIHIVNGKLIPKVWEFLLAS